MNVRSRWVPLLALAIGGIALLAAIISISVGERGPATVTIEGSSTVQRLYGGIPQEDATLGSEEAPVTITLFSDIQCASCADWWLQTVPPLVEDLVRPGRARLEYRHFSLGPTATQAASFAAVAAGEQGRQWQYLHLFALNQQEARPGGVTEELMSEVAGAVPQLDTDRWAEDRDLPEVEESVRADADLATELRLPANPVVVVEGAEGIRRLEDSPSLEEIEAAVAQVSASG